MDDHGTGSAPERRDMLEAVARRFDEGAFERRLGALVAVPSTSQDPAAAPELRRYLAEGVAPWLQALGFSVEVHPNPVAGIGPILLAARVEDPRLPTVVTYGHGDTVLGMDAAWTRGAGPWRLAREGDRWYGRGTADNKGQHAINLFALEGVIGARGGRLGFNLKLVLETAEECGSGGLRAFVAAHADELSGDVFLGSDGPRVAPDRPTVAAGSRGSYRFDLACRPRAGGVHSGHWGGLTTDPAVVIANALATLCDGRGRVLVRDWLPAGGRGLEAATRDLLRECPVDPGTDAATVEPGWGEPDLSPAEKLYAWNSVIVLALVAGDPATPGNAVPPFARATCQIRYVPGTSPDGFMPALRRHLDAAGYADVVIENAHVTMPASAVSPAAPWVTWVRDSIARSLGSAPQVIPCTSGGMPGDVFQDVLGLPLVWLPHGHNGCQQHGPDEHLLVAAAREGALAAAGLWWDLGDETVAKPRPS